MRDRLLIRHFLFRFLDHDLIAPNADRHVLLSILGATLAALSLFVAVLIAAPYQFFPLMPPGMASLRWLDERFFFTSASMLLLALVAVAQWDALALDSRDTAALGVLPIPRAMIVRTKFIAVALLGIGVAVIWNLAPTLLRFVAVPPLLGVTVRGAVALTLAHGVTTLAAGAFGFLAVVGLHEGMAAMLGTAGFRRISAGVQATLIVALATALLLLPGITSVASNRLARGGLASKAVPSFWFVGLHETLVSSVVDAVMQTRPQRMVAVTSDIVQMPGESDRVFRTRRRDELAERRRAEAERNATNLYRSLRPLHHELALMGIVALVIAGVATTGACLWNSRTLPLAIGRPASQEGPLRRRFRWLVIHLIVRTSIQQAGFFFTLQTLSRQLSHRVALASSLAVGLSLTLITARGRAWVPSDDVGSLPLTLLAGQWLLLASVLGGFRHAVRIPADLRASTTFSLAWAGDLAPYMSGVKRAGWIALVVPTLGGLFVWHAIVLGARLAALHLGVGVVVSAFLMETLFVRYRRLPFASSYVPSAELKSRGVAYVAALLLVSFALARIERFALTGPAEYLTLVAIVAALGTGMRVFDRGSRRPAFPLDLNEEPAMPTQRLNLAG